MNSPLLAQLPNLHGTLLSIIIGFAAAFALYAYQTITSSQQKLDEIIKEMQRISNTGIYYGIDKKKGYIDADGKIIWKKFMHGLRDASFWTSNLVFSERTGIKKIIITDDAQNNSEKKNLAQYRGYKIENDVVYVSKTKIEESARTILELYSLAMRSYPYQVSEVRGEYTSIENIDYDKWLEDINLYNGFLISLWEGDHEGLTELMNLYRSIEVQRQIDMEEKTHQETLNELEGEDIALIERVKEGLETRQTIICPVDYLRDLKEFISVAVQIDWQIIKRAKESLNILKMHENNFKLKNRSVVMLTIAILIFIAGIIVPMLLTAYCNGPIAKSIEIAFFIATISPYLFGLFYLISVVVGLEEH